MGNGKGAVENMEIDGKFFKGKRIFLTGHTGFKGMWLCKLLEMLGAEVTGYALAAPTIEGAAVLQKAGILKDMQSITGDIRDEAKLNQAFQQAQPEIVIHLAAQPLVRAGYAHPAETYSTNVMGTVNLLECLRRSNSVKSFLNVTTDKVYANMEEYDRAYTEQDVLDGYDPYSNSKSCSELVTHTYKRSFFANSALAISTARAGNVIGGGDFAADRIIPDCVRAAYAGRPIVVRNPHSIRPYQHVLEPLYAYLLIVQAQYLNPAYAGSYNVGPNEEDCITTGTLVEKFCQQWGDNQTWFTQGNSGPHEATFLKLDCTKLKQTFSWKPRWHIQEALSKTVEWAKVYQYDGDIRQCMEKEIEAFLENK